MSDTKTPHSAKSLADLASGKLPSKEQILKDLSQQNLDLKAQLSRFVERYEDLDKINAGLSEKTESYKSELNAQYDEIQAYQEKFSQIDAEVEEHKEIVRQQAVQIDNYERDKADLSQKLLGAESALKSESIKEQRNLAYGLSFTLFIFIIVGYLFVEMLTKNPQIITINIQTASVFAKATNALLLLVIPFVFGSLGGVTRLLISGFTVTNNMGVIAASGMFGLVSWIALKSNIFLAIISPFIEQQTGASIAPSPDLENTGFYTMLFVAIFVGMFSTNIFLIVQHRIDQVTQSKQQESPN